MYHAVRIFESSVIGFPFICAKCRFYRWLNFYRRSCNYTWRNNQWRSVTSVILLGSMMLIIYRQLYSDYLVSTYMWRNRGVPWLWKTQLLTVAIHFTNNVMFIVPCNHIINLKFIRFVKVHIQIFGISFLWLGIYFYVFKLLKRLYWYQEKIYILFLSVRSFFFSIELKLNSHF